MSTKHSIAAAEFLKDEANSKWHDETLWMVRQKRDLQAKQLPEWEDLRETAYKIKRYSLTHLDEMLLKFEENAKKNGVIVHWAKDAKEHNEIVLSLLNKHNVSHFIKSKSMLTEECHLNPFLEENGIEVIESDLGERIIQFMGLMPSHIVLPAVHIKREQVGEVFEKELGTEKGNSDPTYLTHAARKHLREKFINVQGAMTGGNFAIAETGEVVVCTNEGNADMGMACQNLNICSFGIEKIIPNRESLGVFTRLLARSATGQPSTSYTSFFRKPRKGSELHYIIVDNERSKILGNERHKKILNCIRCGACMNTCPVYRRSGGYSYTYFIPGPLGINLGMAHNPEKYSDNVSACSLCHSCSDVCPVKIDLAEQIYAWRQELPSFKKESKEKKMLSQSLKFIMERPWLYKAGVSVAPIINKLPKKMVYNSMNKYGKERDIPNFKTQSFEKWWNNKEKE